MSASTSAFAPLKPTTGELYEAGVKYQPPWIENLHPGVGVRSDPAKRSVDRSGQSDLPNPDRRSTFEGIRDRRQGQHHQSSRYHRQLHATPSDRHAQPRHRPWQAADMDPELHRRAVGDYTFREGPLNGFGAALGVRYTGQTWGDKGNVLLDVPQYTLIDAALHYELEGSGPAAQGRQAQRQCDEPVRPDLRIAMHRPGVRQCLRLRVAASGSGELAIPLVTAWRKRPPREARPENVDVMRHQGRYLRSAVTKRTLTARSVLRRHDGEKLGHTCFEQSSVALSALTVCVVPLFCAYGGG